MKPNWVRFWRHPPCLAAGGFAPALFASFLAVSLLPPGGLVCCIHGDGSPNLELANVSGRCDPAQHDEAGPAWSGPGGPGCQDIPLTPGGARGEGARPLTPQVLSPHSAGAGESFQAAAPAPLSSPIPLFPRADIRRC